MLIIERLYILYKLLNQDLFYKNKIWFVVESNNKKEENNKLTLSIIFK